MAAEHMQHDSTVIAWIADREWVIILGLMGVVWWFMTGQQRALEKRLGSLEHTVGGETGHGSRLTAVEHDVQYIHKSLEEQREMMRETRDLVQRIAGKLDA